MTVQNVAFTIALVGIGEQVVEVVGRQWSWQITPSTIEAGNAVEFRVTSADVNHGFAVWVFRSIWLAA